jgi:hypothetical protein
VGGEPADDRAVHDVDSAHGDPWSDAEETPLLELPGFLLVNYGRRTALWTLVCPRPPRSKRRTG